MANIPLKSIKFPDLDDTYTVPSNAGELPYNKSATYPADTVGKALQNIGDSSAPAIIETAQGSIASFDDGADNVPVKDLIAEIVPLQSGSGDPSPSNVRVISGWTEANIEVAGCAVTNNTTDYIELPFPIENGESYALCNIGHLGADLTLYDENKSQVDWWAVTAAYPNENQKTNNYNKTIKYIRARNTNGKPLAIRNVTKGQSYDITTHTISFASAGTVYGGRLDVTSGVLTVDRAIKTFDGSENWKASSNPDRYYVDYDDTTFPYKWAADVTAISNAYKYYGIASSSSFLSDEEFMLWAPVGFPTNTLREIIFYNSSVGSLANFKTYLGNNNVQVVFDLNDPITYQLTPTEVKSLLKNNNVWADTGDVTVEYVADTKTFIENLVNA